VASRQYGLLVFWELLGVAIGVWLFVKFRRSYLRFDCMSFHDLLTRSRQHSNIFPIKFFTSCQSIRGRIYKIIHFRLNFDILFALDLCHR
jgi:hypothetical protein